MVQDLQSAIYNAAKDGKLRSLKVRKQNCVFKIVWSLLCRGYGKPEIALAEAITEVSFHDLELLIWIRHPYKQFCVWVYIFVRFLNT
jgi:hypothetical protein